MYNTSEYVYLDEYITQVGQGGKAIHRKVIQDCLKIPPSFLHLFWIHNRCKSNKASRDAESTISLWVPVEEKGLLRINIFLAFLKVWFWGRPTVLAGNGCPFNTGNHCMRSRDLSFHGFRGGQYIRGGGLADLMAVARLLNLVGHQAGHQGNSHSR